MTVWPDGTTRPPRISSPYGPRSAPGPGASTMHYGADMVGFTTIRATDPGVVLGIGVLPGWAGGGQQVHIDHGSHTTRSLHMATGSLQVSRGQRVDARTPLGTMGKTGTAFGVHMHFEVAVRGVRVDPVKFLASRISSPAGGGSKPFPGPEEQEQDMARPIIYQVQDARFQGTVLAIAPRLKAVASSAVEAQAWIDEGGVIKKTIQQMEPIFTMHGIPAAQLSPENMLTSWAG